MDDAGQELATEVRDLRFMVGVEQRRTENVRRQVRRWMMQYRDGLHRRALLDLERALIGDETS